MSYDNWKGQNDRDADPWGADPDDREQEYEPATLPPGIHRGVPMAQYLGLDAVGSTELGWLAVSALNYRYQKDQRAERDSEATALGTAVHMAVLEPELFAVAYVDEPDLDAIGGAKPRATKAYKEQLAALETGGRKVLTAALREQVESMAAAVWSHPIAAKLLARAPERELTLRWDREYQGANGETLTRPCRGRADALGDGVLVDLKTTRSLARFSPFEITRFRYFVQSAWYREGLAKLGRPITYSMLIAVESVAPFDVAVLSFDQAAKFYGEHECERLVTLLNECEQSGEWPGMFPNVTVATITDSLAADLSAEDAA